MAEDLTILPASFLALSFANVAFAFASTLNRPNWAYVPFFCGAGVAATAVAAVFVALATALVLFFVLFAVLVSVAFVLSRVFKVEESISSLGAALGAFGSAISFFSIRTAVTEISTVVPASAPSATAASDDN